MYKPTTVMPKTSSLLFISLLLIWSSFSSSSPIRVRMADKPVDSSSSAAAVYIVYTEKPDGEEPEAYHIRTLTSVIGSEESAKELLLYSYKNAASGFSAKLTPEQVSEISKQPGVLQVVPSRTVKLHSGPAKLHGR